MRSTTAVTLPLALGFAALAWTDASNALTLQPESRLWIDGTSTLRAFRCNAGSFDASIEATPGAVKAIIGGERAVQSVVVTVPAEKLDCGNGKMNEHMLKALKASQHEAIVFRVGSYNIEKGTDGVSGTLIGTLTLGGVTKDVAIPAAARADAAGLLRVTGTHEIAMSEYGLKRPTLMMGTLKVGDKVMVGFDLLIRE